MIDHSWHGQVIAELHALSALRIPVTQLLRKRITHGWSTK
jgi:hypothetical protein